MSLKVDAKLASLTAQKDIKLASGEEAKELLKLSSGKRIVSAGDDVVGASQALVLESEIRSLKQANRNNDDALSFVQVAEGGLANISNLLIRLKEIAIQGASETITDQERDLTVFEHNQMLDEIDRVAEGTVFGDLRLLNGKENDDIFVQAGITGNDIDQIGIDQSHFDATTDNLNLDKTRSASVDFYYDTIEHVDDAIQEISLQRAELGGLQNRFHSASENNSVYELNLESARSKILDTDIAESASKLVSAKLHKNAAVSILSQTNSLTEKSLNRLIG